MFVLIQGSRSLWRLISSPSTITRLASSECNESSSMKMPKRPLSAFFSFMKEQRSTLQHQTPDLKITEISKQLASSWHALSDNEKLPYLKRAHQDFATFKEQKQRFLSSLSTEEKSALQSFSNAKMMKNLSRQRKAELTALGVPKRFRNAYIFFFSENFETAQGVLPQNKTLHLASEWKRLTSMERQKYQKLAEKDFTRYQQERSAWEEQMLAKGHQAILKTPRDKKTTRSFTQTGKTSRKTISTAQEKGKSSVNEQMATGKLSKEE
uniref:Transcription factor A, mitochondrial n=1 Tax=Eptatretus burgeri TaxID=7764 RepID=A0A8C4N848_EPTBU